LIGANGVTSYELYSIGSQLDLKGKTSEAIEYYQQAVELDPEAVELYAALINAYYQLRKYDEGIAWAKRGLDRIPGDAKLYLSIAIGYIGKGDFKKSIEYYRHSLEYEEDRTQQEDIYSAIATIYEVLGDLKSARQTRRSKDAGHLRPARYPFGKNERPPVGSRLLPEELRPG
jgi:tetratricopeptide (TPR) repeat protein